VGRRIIEGDELINYALKVSIVVVGDIREDQSSIYPCD